MKRTWLAVAALAALAIWAAIALARANGAPASRTGAPAIGGVTAEGLCTGCHSGNAVNTNGSVTVLGVPPLFRAGATYRLTVHLASTQQNGNASRTWGFQVTAVDTANGQGAGTFALVNAAQTSLVSGSGSFSTREYVDQSSGGTKGGAASPADWLVDWTAPATGSTRVRFYVAGLAGDGSGTGGDWAYTGTVASTDTITAALPATWGQVKAQYLK
jgi:cytochrome c553